MCVCVRASCVFVAIRLINVRLVSVSLLRSLLEAQMLQFPSLRAEHERADAIDDVRQHGVGDQYADEDLLELWTQELKTTGYQTFSEYKMYTFSQIVSFCFVYNKLNCVFLRG